MVPSGLHFELALVMSAAAKADYFSSIRFPVWWKSAPDSRSQLLAFDFVATHFLVSVQILSCDLLAPRFASCSRSVCCAEIEAFSVLALQSRKERFWFSARVYRKPLWSVCVSLLSIRDTTKGQALVFAGTESAYLAAVKLSWFFCMSYSSFWFVESDSCHVHLASHVAGGVFEPPD
jgi:hypothetical protein